ncbi:MAG: GAF domain-containing protein [Candidatus Latescibacteria bacterium]|nr:GAF domain-containing protein [Candidatus Latescibacterota bacterium]NIM22592.1 GAF domain-containing protein [Candidatus Latescibacterota bacterium]NIM64881.1 GAF domain-containing protein [Candidatus Latescibacterota bacterium]NIO01396.1 GAF domain-containing protein [Candidatus Latescibacterota bacterium]NIO27906.1 GAF domain-containing protein [Candidatus Latescibacterota bacterium]
MEVANRIISLEWGAAYMFLAVILSLLVLYDLIKGRKVVQHRVYELIFLAVLTFLLARGLAFAFMSAIDGGRLFPETLWAALNLMSLIFAAFGLTKLLVQYTPAHENHHPSPENPEGASEEAILLQQTGYLFVAGGFTCFFLTQAGALSLTAIGIVNMALFTAMARPVMFIFEIVHGFGPEQRRGLYISIPWLAVSWLAMFAAMAFHTGVGAFRTISMLADLLLLFSGLALLHSHNMRLGLYYKNKSDASMEEMTRAKEELAKLSKIASDVYEDNNVLIKRQKEQTLSLAKRVENLEKVLHIGLTIQKRKELGELLQMIVDLVRENLGFKTVILRLLNEKTHSFETRAYAGLNEEVRETVLSYRMPQAEYEKMIEAKFRMSKSYFFRQSSLSREGESGEAPEEGESMLVGNAWGDIDLLIVPLTEEGSGTIGYLSVENPENANVSIAEVIENLESVASLAVAAIRNANLFGELESKNEKLKSYTSKISGLNKMKANFIATVSHEFRTPLTSIKAYCETLLKNVDQVERKILREFLVVIEEESGRLMTLIEDILDFSQMESGAIKFERTPCSLNETITIAAKEMEKNFKQKNITLHQELPDSEVTIRAERELMKQLIINLLHNASKFTPDGGNVWIRLENETLSARIIVEDDGIGIPEEQIDMIFDRFHQVDGSTTRKYGGPGLGLAICKNIVDWHDGRIWVENHPDRGSRFIIVLPKKEVVVRSQLLNLGEMVHRFEVERYMELLVELVAELVGAKRVSIMLFDDTERELRVESAIGLDEEVVEHAKLKAGEGIAGRILREGKSWLVQDIEKDPRLMRKNNDFLYESNSFLSVPIMKEEQVVGVVNVANHISKARFDAEDCKLLELFAERLSAALVKLGRFVETSIDFSEVRATFKAILDVKRYIDVQNAEGITELVSKVAKKLGLGEEQQSSLRYLMSVYDLGLSKVGYHIIKKPFELSAKDRKAIEQHTVQGAEMLKTFEMARNIRDIILYHHENFDGTGYPGKLSGEAIPIEARILRVADSLRALISNRPYQKKYTLDEAKDVIRHRSGTFFDPNIVDAFLEKLEECGHLFPRRDDVVGGVPEGERA